MVRSVTTDAKDCLFLGRGLSFPIALEGALKLKEISYVHAEGYAAGEMKHGPIALIDSQMPVVVVAQRNCPEESSFATKPSKLPPALSVVEPKAAAPWNDPAAATLPPASTASA